MFAKPHLWGGGQLPDWPSLFSLAPPNVFISITPRFCAVFCRASSETRFASTTVFPALTSCQIQLTCPSWAQRYKVMLCLNFQSKRFLRRFMTFTPSRACKWFLSLPAPGWRVLSTCRRLLASVGAACHSASGNRCQILLLSIPIRPWRLQFQSCLVLQAFLHPAELRRPLRSGGERAEGERGQRNHQIWGWCCSGGPEGDRAAAGRYELMALGGSRFFKMP